jgi:hypothetical protein
MKQPAQLMTQAQVTAATPFITPTTSGPILGVFMPHPAPLTYLPSEEKLLALGFVLDWRAPHATRFLLPNARLEKSYWNALTLCTPAHATAPDCVMLSIPTGQFLMSFRPASEAFFDELLVASRFRSSDYVSLPQVPPRAVGALAKPPPHRE